MSASIAETFSQLPESERQAFIFGVTLAYRDVMNALAPAFVSGGIDKAFSDIRDQYREVTALIAVEGVCDK